MMTIAKAESDKYSAFSGLYDAEAQVTKLQSEFTSFEIRNGLYFIRAPTRWVHYQSNPKWDWRNH